MRALAQFELKYFDVFGPMPVPSLLETRYFLTLINDYSRFTWIYFLKKKSQVMEKTKHNEKLIENHFAPA